MIKINVEQFKAIIALIGKLTESEISKLIGEKNAKILNEFYFTRRME